MNKFLLLVIASFFSFVSGYGQTVVNFNSGSTNWICPAGVTSIKVEAWGSGSGGGSNGGGGGAFAGNNTLAVTPGVTYLVTVGAGGNSGNNGQDSSFGTLVIAKGAVGAAGGLASASTGTIKYNGGNGGSSGGNSGGGGGGSAGSLGDGGNGGNGGGNSPGVGGLGGSGISGVGGAGGGNKESGNDGLNPGGGGGVSGNSNSVNGKGGNGKVVITYACKVYSLTGVSVPTSACTPPSTIVVTLSGSANGLPVGNYTVTYTRSDPNATGLTASMTVTTAGTGVFTAVGLTNPDNAGTTITVTNLASGSCSNGITSNNISNTFVLRAPLSAPSGLNGYGSCPNYIVQWNNGSPRVDNYFLDVSTSNTFGTFLAGYNSKDLGTAFSATITGLASGTTYYYRVRAANVCGTSGNSAVASFVAPGVSVAPITGGSTTVCVGSQTPAFNDATSGGTWSIINGTGSATITSGGIVSGSTPGTVTVVYSVSNNGCTSSVTMPLTVNALPSKPTVGVPNQPNCNSNKGSVSVSNLPTSGILVQNIGGVITNYTITGQTMNITGLSPGDYTFRASVGSCSSIVSDIVKINPVTTTSWTGTSWSKGIPTLSDEAIINANYDTSIHGKIDACSLIINNATLIVGNQNFVTIQNDLTVNPSGVMKILNQGSLVMINDSGIITYKGIIEVNKTTTPFEKYDYTYWSSPIVGPANIGAIFPTWRTDYAFAFHPENFIDANNDGFDDNGDDYINASTMDPGRGYIIMGPTSGSFPRTESVVFTGKVNNGVVKTDIVLTPGTDPEDDFNLVGNPYPSAISADALIKANISGTGTINKTIEGTLYFWTHKADISVSNPGPDGLNFSQDDYAVYNLSGGVGTSGSASGGGKPLGYIASGQGFFVEADVAGYLTFNNSMRVSPSIVSSQPTPTNANTQFYKILPTKDKAVSKDRVWLNLENEDGMFSQQLVGYFENTTMGFDNGYDGLVSDAGNYVSFYSFIDEGIYKIQGRESFDNKDQVRLGYFSAVAGPFNINIDSKEGVFDEDQTNVYLEDKLTNTIHDLKKGPYNFETDSGTFNDRFVLRYTDKTLGTGDFDKANLEVAVTVKNKEIKINSEIEMLDKILIFDISGKLIYKKANINNNETTVVNLTSGVHTLLVKIVLKNGQNLTRKIIY